MPVWGLFFAVWAAMRAAEVVGVDGVERGRIVSCQVLPVWKLCRGSGGRVEVGTRCRYIVPRQLPEVRNVSACPLVVDVDV